MTAMPIRSAVTALPAYHFRHHDQPVKLDQNESPWDLPEALRERSLERLAELPSHRYPELHAERLRERIASFEDWPEAGVVVAPGSNVLIQAAAIAAGLGRRVLSVTPSFSLYALQAQLVGADLRLVPLDPGFELPRAALLGELAHGEGVHFLAAPMAPTGNAVEAAEVEALVRAGERRWLTVVDEAYGAFAGSDHAAVVREHDTVVSLRTFSKAFGLAGVRLGYALADEALAEQLQKVVLPFAVSSLQAAVLETVLEAPAYVAERVATLRAERDRLAALLRARPALTIFPSVTNFLLLRVADAEATFAGLAARGVLVRRQDHLPGLEGCLRVSVGTRAENDAFVAALDEALADAASPEGAHHANV